MLHRPWLNEEPRASARAAPHGIMPATPAISLLSFVLALVIGLFFCPHIHADVPVVTILADFEDDSVAASVGDVRNVARTACILHHPIIPARGQRCLALDIGVTGGPTSVVCDLRFREPRRFQQADRVAAFCWIKRGSFELAYRIRDARGQVFETTPQTIQTHNRWIRIAHDLDSAELHRIHGDGSLVWPIQIQGYRTACDRLGKQTLYLDDLQVEHHVEQREMIHGAFIFDEPTRIYEPGSTVDAAIEIENCSREQMLQVSVALAWTRPDGSILQTQRASLNLQASGHDFRSRQTIDFSQRIDQPGLYRLVARAHVSGWIFPSVFETSIAVTPSNRLVPRGRATFFAVRADLMREPTADQDLEIKVARDIGVHMLAIDTPWRRIEPAADRFDFSMLDPVIDDIVRMKIAPLIVLTAPPEWLTDENKRIDRIGIALARLAKHYGPRVTHYQPDGDVLPTDDFPDLVARLKGLQDGLRQVNPEVLLISPPLSTDVAFATSINADLLGSETGLQWSFRTQGDPAEAFRNLEQFRKTIGFQWQPGHWWFHEAQPLAGPSFFSDAEAVLHHYVRAALAGVSGVVWYDLRDNDNDPGQQDTLRGLVRRDFSPKASLQGYVSAVGMLTGLTCRGPVLGTPPEFESALFIGSDRQIAMLLPKSNRIRPAAVAVLQGVAGEVTARDFERRSHPVLTSEAAPLVPTLARPLFVSLELDNSQPEPQIAFAKSWLHAPATVFCGNDQQFTIGLSTPMDIERGSLRLKLPRNAPFEADPSRRFFNAQRGEQLEFPIKLRPVDSQSFEHAELTLKMTLDDQVIELPIEVRPLISISPYDGNPDNLANPQNKLGNLTASENQRASAGGTVYAAYEHDYLHLLIVVEDDRFVPGRISDDGNLTGDDLLFGISAENSTAHAELHLDIASAQPPLRPARGTIVAGLDRWQCTCTKSGSGNDELRRCHIRIPKHALGLQALEQQTRLLLSVRYRDDDADGLPATILSWGGGLQGSHSAQDFRWIQLER